MGNVAINAVRTTMSQLFQRPDCNNKKGALHGERLRSDRRTLN